MTMFRMMLFQQVCMWMYTVAFIAYDCHSSRDKGKNWVFYDLQPLYFESMFKCFEIKLRGGHWVTDLDRSQTETSVIVTHQSLCHSPAPGWAPAYRHQPMWAWALPGVRTLTARSHYLWYLKVLVSNECDPGPSICHHPLIFRTPEPDDKKN